MPRRNVRRVLVATDLSRNGNRAALYAPPLIAEAGIIRLLHVVHPRGLPESGSERLSDQNRRRAQESLIDSAYDQLRDLVPTASARGVTWEVEVVEHEQPSIAIAQAVERFGADVVCLAARPRATIAAVLFPSRIAKVLGRSGRPILLVPPEQES